MALHKYQNDFLGEYVNVLGQFLFSVVIFCWLPAHAMLEVEDKNSLASKISTENHFEPNDYRMSQVTFMHCFVAAHQKVRDKQCTPEEARDFKILYDAVAHNVINTYESSIRLSGHAAWSGLLRFVARERTYKYAPMHYDASVNGIETQLYVDTVCKDFDGKQKLIILGDRPEEVAEAFGRRLTVKYSIHSTVDFKKNNRNHHQKILRRFRQLFER